MKFPLSLLLILPVVFFVAGAPLVVAFPTSALHTYGARKTKQDESEKPPFVGMTKAQALARYGEPKTRSLTDKGEVWVYLLNYGEVIGRAFIPFNFKPTPIRTGALTFGTNGKVKEFRWDAETNG